MYKCYKCDKMFETLEAKERHKIDKHQPHRRFSSRERPKQRGTVSCGYPMCDATFGAEFNAIQHRRDAHGEMPPWQSEPRGPTVKTSDFESENSGSNPGEAAK